MEVLSFEAWKSYNESNQKDDYMLLDRLKRDCEYFIKTSPSEKHLWARNIKDQINKMKDLYNSLKEKPEWISMKDIEQYEEKMNKALKEG